MMTGTCDPYPRILEEYALQASVDAQKIPSCAPLITA
jgi:hypothetical protein